MMLGLVFVGLGALMLWQGFTGQKVTDEIQRLLSGQAAFVIRKPAGEFGGLEPGDNRLGPPNPNIITDHPQLRN